LRLFRAEAATPRDDATAPTTANRVATIGRLKSTGPRRCSLAPATAVNSSSRLLAIVALVALGEASAVSTTSPMRCSGAIIRAGPFFLDPNKMCLPRQVRSRGPSKLLAPPRTLRSKTSDLKACACTLFLHLIRYGPRHQRGSPARAAYLCRSLQGDLPPVDRPTFDLIRRPCSLARGRARPQMPGSVRFLGHFSLISPPGCTIR
jgi:hypothetical protein